MDNVQNRDGINIPSSQTYKTKTPWSLVRKRSITTERQPLVGELLMPTLANRGVSRGQRGGSLTVVNLSFIVWSRYFSVK
jgi:hypothetical protein